MDATRGDVVYRLIQSNAANTSCIGLKGETLLHGYQKPESRDDIVQVSAAREQTQSLMSTISDPENNHLLSYTNSLIGQVIDARAMEGGYAIGSRHLSQAYASANINIQYGLHEEALGHVCATGLFQVTDAPVAAEVAFPGNPERIAAVRNAIKYGDLVRRRAALWLSCTRTDRQKILGSVITPELLALCGIGAPLEDVSQKLDACITHACTKGQPYELQTEQQDSRENGDQGAPYTIEQAISAVNTLEERLADLKTTMEDGLKQMMNLEEDKRTGKPSD